MLPKSRRLNLKKSFQWVAAGKRTETLHFKLLYRFGENSQALVGIALTTKLFKTAVERNKVKRLASGAVQLIYPALQTSLNLVIMPKPGVLDGDSQNLSKELAHVEAITSNN